MAYHPGHSRHVCVCGNVLRECVCGEPGRVEVRLSPCQCPLPADRGAPIPQLPAPKIPDFLSKQQFDLRRLVGLPTETMLERTLRHREV